MTDPILPALDEKRRRIQSIETGFGLLKVLVDSGQPMMLRDLATQAGMSSAKAHPYLVSFTNVGLVQQAPATGLYELGPFALQMGLVSLQSQNPVKIALPLVQAWASRIGHTLGLAVLGSHGPTMVHISEASYPVHVNMRCGTVMSMLHTATGHVFAAWLPPEVARHYIEREAGDSAVVTSISPLRPNPKELAAMLEKIREQGVAQALGNPLPGIDALSVPVFDHSGQIVLALTSLGPSTLFDASIDSPILAQLRQCANSISHQLGWREPLGTPPL
ncbi:IclR family transcriptional regulator [Alcaligenes aquatilis]|uniref:IclR family transcriptional regulator n=1 Tax=Alcaligenes aquatilis TaxID=323284 RepID=A0A3G2HXR9_9BURK|nr:IclR family transcriptional regulator [Alcaligenes aquatilis]AYN21865.1 IclR family transcriptional regulator [Alcaligenes aquatilis]